jgi:hypothetical protein
MVSFLQAVQVGDIAQVISSYSGWHATQTLRTVTMGSCLFDLVCQPALLAILGIESFERASFDRASGRRLFIHRRASPLEIFHTNVPQWSHFSIPNTARVFEYACSNAVVVGREVCIFVERHGLYAFDVDRNRWYWHGRLGFPQGTVGLALASFDGVVFLLGGLDRGQGLTKAKQYCPKDKSQRYMDPCPEPRRFASAIGVHGSVFLLGGESDEEQAMRSVARFSLARRCWERGPSMQRARLSGAVVNVRERIFVCGGDDKGADDPLMAHWRGLSAVEMLDLAGDPLRWVHMPNMNCVRDRASAASIGNYIYVFGGRDDFMTDESLKTGEMFTGDGWKRLPDMRVGRLDFGLVALPI